jgi:hypothetical protein
MFQKRFLFQLGICCNLLVLSVWFTTRYWRFHMSDTRPLATASYTSAERFRIQFRKLICISNNALPAFLPIWCLHRYVPACFCSVSALHKYAFFNHFHMVTLRSTYFLSLGYLINKFVKFFKIQFNRKLQHLCWKVY